MGKHDVFRLIDTGCPLDSCALAAVCNQQLVVTSNRQAYIIRTIEYDQIALSRGRSQRIEGGCLGGLSSSTCPDSERARDIRERNLCPGWHGCPDLQEVARCSL